MGFPWRGGGVGIQQSPQDGWWAQLPSTPVPCFVNFKIISLFTLIPGGSSHLLCSTPKCRHNLTGHYVEVCLKGPEATSISSVEALASTPHTLPPPPQPPASLGAAALAVLKLNLSHLALFICLPQNSPLPLCLVPLPPDGSLGCWEKETEMERQIEVLPGPLEGRAPPTFSARLCCLLASPEPQCKLEWDEIV